MDGTRFACSERAFLYHRLGAIIKLASSSRYQPHLTADFRGSEILTFQLSCLIFVSHESYETKLIQSMSLSVSLLATSSLNPMTKKKVSNFKILTSIKV